MDILTILRRNKGTATVDNSPLDLLKAAVGSLNKLPMLPAAATRAMSLANDPNTPLASFSALIETDPALATGTLKLANSSLYSAGRVITSLNQAVVRLGLRECQNLIVAVGMRSLFRNITLPRRQQCEQLWGHSFLTACMCRHLNREVGLGHNGEEFACGLTHDLGRILFAIGASATFDTADSMNFVEGPELLVRERQLFGTDHCHFGAWFANLNNLPTTLVSAIQFHHEPEQADQHKSLVELVATADDMANHLQRLESADSYSPATNPGWLVLAQRCSAEQRKRVENTATDIMNAAAKEAQEVMGFTLT